MNDLPTRKSPRADFHDYCGGTYFVTICTAGKMHYFGRIIDGEMQLNDIGRYCGECIEQIFQHHHGVDVPIFTVMPNHVHAILCIKGEEPDATPKRSVLSIVIGGLKQSVTIYARQLGKEFGWQRSYHDHIIRNRREANYIARYIRENPAKWEYDCFHPRKADRHLRRGDS